MTTLNLEIRHLLLVQTVAAVGNLTRAGQTLNLTQSALSHQLLDIERRLGTPLFHRVGKRMVLTPAGQKILRSAVRVLDDLRRTEEEVRLIAREKRGLLRLTTECYTCYHWLPALMTKFAAKHPGVDVRIDADATKRAIDALIEGSVDLAIISSAPDDRRLALHPLFEDEMVCIMAPDHHLGVREYIRAKDLAGETLLTYAELEDSTAWQRLLRPAGLQPAAWMRVQLTEAMVELVRGGVGVAVVARWSVWPQIEARAIAAVPLTRRGLNRKWMAATLAGAALPSYLESFIEMLATQPPRQRDVALHVPARARR